MILLRLTIASLFTRALTVGMTVVAIALSVALFLGVEKIRTGAKLSFVDTISGTDLIMGARAGSVQLLLYSVFRIGNATNNISWASYQDISSRPEVNWAVPISLGDSHGQFRVMGTTPAFFEHYKYRQGQTLKIANGHAMTDLFDAVIGADVAKTLGYSVDDPITIAHGIASFVEHEDQPFRIAGILEKTGTPVDRTVIISLPGFEAIHVDWAHGTRVPGQSTPVEEIRQMNLTPQAISAVLIGVNSPLETFHLQRAINEYPQEPLLAILPGVALHELWAVVGIAESALLGVSVMVVVTAFVGMTATVISSLNERRREMAILRAMGARPATIVTLLVLEAMMTTAVAALLGILLLYVGLICARPLIDNAFGIWLHVTAPTFRDALILMGIVATSAVVSVAPAGRAYRLSLADGMVVRN